jgi:hypothetical protein
MNPHTWDESLPYVQSYSRALHNSIFHRFFQVCPGFYPFTPVDVALLLHLHKNIHPFLKLRETKAPKSFEWIDNFQIWGNCEKLYQ